MKKINIIKKSEEYNFIIKNARYISNKYFVIYLYNNDLNHYRFGISVPKKLGKANIRNRIKRQIKNIADDYQNLFKNNQDCIIIVKELGKDLSYHEKKKELNELFEKANIYKKEN